MTRDRIFEGAALTVGVVLAVALVVGTVLGAVAVAAH